MIKNVLTALAITSLTVGTANAQDRQYSDQYYADARASHDRGDYRERDRHERRRDRRDRIDGGDVLIGIVGGVILSELIRSDRHYYRDLHYRGRYYDRRRCWSERRYDPYRGRRGEYYWVRQCR